MEKHILTHNASAGLGGYNRLYRITHDHLTEPAANTAQTIALETVGLGTVVKGAAIYLKTPFEDTADNALNTTTLIVGDSGATNRFLTSTELNVNGTEILAKATANSVDTLPHAYVAAGTINAVFGSMAAKTLLQLNRGEVWIYLELADLRRASG